MVKTQKQELQVASEQSRQQQIPMRERVDAAVRIIRVVVAAIIGVVFAVVFAGLIVAFFVAAIVDPARAAQYLVHAEALASWVLGVVMGYFFSRGNDKSR